MKQNKQSERSRQWLIDALLALMESKSFDSITVTDITNKAGVARLTFYRHFESKEQILLTHFEMLFNSYFEELSGTPEINLRDALCRCFEYWRQDEKIAKLLVRHNMKTLLHQSFGDYLERVLETNVLPRNTNHFQRKFIEGGLLFTMTDWVLDSKNYSPEDMADMILELINIRANDNNQ